MFGFIWSECEASLSSSSSFSSLLLLLFSPMVGFEEVSEGTKDTGARAPSWLWMASASTVQEPSSILEGTLISPLHVYTLLLSTTCSMAGPIKNVFLSERRCTTREIPVDVAVMATGLKPERTSLPPDRGELLTTHFGACWIQPLYNELFGNGWVNALPSALSLGTGSSSDTLKTRSDDSDGDITFATFTITWGPSIAATVPKSLFSLSRKITSLTSQISKALLETCENCAFLLTLVWGLEDLAKSFWLEINSSSTAFAREEFAAGISVSVCTTPLSALSLDTLFLKSGSTLIFVTTVLVPSGDSWPSRRPTMGPLTSQYL